MTAPEAEHHNQHSLPVTLSLRTSQSPHDLPSNHNATRKEFTSLNQQVSTFYSAELLQGIHTEDVFQFLSSAISPMYVTGIKELIKTGEAHGFETELQFFRCNDRSTIAPVALAFKKITLAGDVMYGLPNVSAILDAPEERLRGDNSSSGKKLTRATDGTAEDGEAGTYGGKITFETFRDPVRILISESTDTELHRPFDLAAQYSQTIESDAVARMTEALTSEGPFSFLAECVIHPHLTQFLSRYSQLFGAREKADIVQVTQHKEGSLLITVLNPELKEGVPLTFRTEIDFSPFASVRLSEVDESR